MLRSALTNLGGNSLSLIALVVLTDGLAGQFLNRAVYLGRDNESVRRDYDQSANYYLDRMQYVDLPAWWQLDFRPFRNHMLATGGSVSTDELTFEGSVQQRRDLGHDFAVHFHYLQSENLASQYRRAAFGLEYDLFETTSVFALIEGVTDKSQADFSFGTSLFKTENTEHRLTFTFVDFPEGKTDQFTFAKDPYALMFSGFARADQGVELGYELGVQLPFEQNFDMTGESMELYRTVGRGEIRVPLTAVDKLIAAAYGELVGVDSSFADPADVRSEDVDGTLVTARLEWWHQFEEGYHVTVGGSIVRQDDEFLRPNDPAMDWRVRRGQYVAQARLRWPLGELVMFEPNLYLGYLDFSQRRGAVLDSTRGFVGKAGLPVVLRFNETAHFSVMISLQLDKPEFGGGGIQFFAQF